MPLLPASLAIPPGGEVPARHTCNDAVVFLSLTMSGLPGCGQAPRPRPDGACPDLVRTAQPYLFQARVGLEYK
jgi:hypothetical protein